MKILLADSPGWEEVGDEFQKEYVKNVEAAYKKAAKLLPFGSEYLSFVAQPREHSLIKKTHDAARTHNSGLIELAFSSKYASKHPDKILSQVIAGVFHEMSHASRFNIPIWHKTFLDNCILEGLATVFERDYTDYSPPWADYPKEVKDWLKEIRKNEKTLNYGEYMYTHPDGRKWIGYKVGTYIIDEALKKSGTTVIELTQMECQEILELSRVIDS